jgi:hypothetical protein
VCDVAEKGVSVIEGERDSKNGNEENAVGLERRVETGSVRCVTTQ